MVLVDEVRRKGEELGRPGVGRAGEGFALHSMHGLDAVVLAA